jgi:hypothetical protein
MNTPVKITTTFTTIDGFKERKTFKTLEGARRYAKRRMGDNFDIGSYYAVDMYGTGKLMVDGTSLAKLLYSDEDLAKLKAFAAERRDAMAAFDAEFKTEFRTRDWVEPTGSW